MISSGAHGVNIQFYRDENFTGKLNTRLPKNNYKINCIVYKIIPFFIIGLAWESNSTKDCNDIPKFARTDALFFRTNTCFIAYYDSNCKSKMSQKYMPGDIGPFSWE